MKTKLVILLGCLCIVLAFLGMWEVVNETENLPANNRYLAVSIGYGVLATAGFGIIWFRKTIADKLVSRRTRRFNEMMRGD